MDFLISAANAQAAGAQPGGMMQPVFLMVAMLALMYFMVIRPQSQKTKEHQALLAKLEVGNEVVTAGGILGRITKAGDTYLSIEIAKDVEIKVQRYQIAQVLPTGSIKNA